MSRSEAFIAALQPHRGILYRIARVYCQQAGERADLVQDMLLELWRAWPRFDASTAAVSTWMHQIGVNVAISRHRGEQRRIRDAEPLESSALDMAAADAALDADPDLLALQQLIDQLDALNKAVILLYLEGYSLAESGALLGLSASNVGTRIGRIKQRLQQLQAAEACS